MDEFEERARAAAVAKNAEIRWVPDTFEAIFIYGAQWAKNYLYLVLEPGIEKNKRLEKMSKTISRLESEKECLEQKLAMAIRALNALLKDEDQGALALKKEEP